MLDELQGDAEQLVDILCFRDRKAYFEVLENEVGEEDGRGLAEAEEQRAKDVEKEVFHHELVVTEQLLEIERFERFDHAIVW